jgi:hypothetical protein
VGISFRIAAAGLTAQTLQSSLGRTEVGGLGDVKVSVIP